MSSSIPERRAFFYGTLMHPKILTRVIDNDGAHLQFCSALLLDYTRHEVMYADYPGIAPYSKTRRFFNHELTTEERCVRGTLVAGLTKNDMKRLTTFEGPQYELNPVQIHLLSHLIPFTSIDWSSNSPIEHPPPLPSFSALPDPIESETYVFKDINELEPTLWSFETFIKEDAWKWHRQEGEIEGKGHAAGKGEEEEGGEGSHSGFFYGTLMHPKILKKVIKNEGEHLEFCSALLLDYTRHEVMHADYPGIVPYSKGKALFDRELSQEERSVRGTLVTGLTHHDMRLLNLFEGREYDLLSASVHPLSALAPVSTHNISTLSIPEHPPPLPPLSDLPPAVPCEVYVYKFLNGLNPRLWDFEHFVKNNAWKWHGGEEGKALQEEQSEVARRFEREQNAQR